MKVLIVEDEVRIREGLIKLLEKIGNEYEVVGQANDGSEGLKLCRTLKPDLVITDVQMPNMDGLEMLKAIFSENINIKAIVLSAYSEFEYARTAMKLGVTEYLLKPINLSDFSLALESIRHQIAEDKKKKPDKVGTLDQILRDIISGRLEPDDNILDYLEKTYAISRKQNFIILFDYLGNQYEECVKKEIKDLEQSLSRYKENSFCVVDLEYRKSLAVVIYKYKSAADFERWIQYQLLQQINDKAAMGYTVSEGINEISESIERLFPYMDWNISFEDDVLISYPKITQVQTLFCVYPQELETKMKAAICASDLFLEKDIMEKFKSSFKDGKVYNPHEIKECYVRFIWAILEIAKSVGNENVRDIKQQKLLDRIMNAKIRAELESVCEDILKMLKVSESSTDAETLTVRRTKSMIHEFYNTGITLDEIAAKLNITPEYLGTQFHKETGVTFSAYIKNYRITKAKELLVGTSLKLYEIAERVGYFDPKYFSKVFRDVTGQLPAEFRKSSK